MSMLTKYGPLYFQSLDDEIKQIAGFIKGRVLNAGCGSRNIDKTFKNCGATDVVNYDIESSIPNAIIGELIKTPFEDASFDTIFTNAVLEHVPDIHGVMTELCRVLKSGGTFIATIPFLQPYHPCPTDFRRYTKHGLEELATLHNLKVDAIYPTHNISQTLGWILWLWGKDHGGWRALISYPLCVLLTRFNTKTDFKAMSVVSAFQLVATKPL